MDVMVELINYGQPPYTTTRALPSNKTRDELIALKVGHIMYLLCPNLHSQTKVKIGQVSWASRG